MQKKIKNLITIVLLLLSSHGLIAQEGNDAGYDWKKLITITKEKEIEFIKTHSIDKDKLESGEKPLDVNMSFYTKGYLIESDEKYHLVLPFYASGAKMTAILFMESIFNSYSQWNVINQDGIPVARSCTVLKETKNVKLKYWDKLNKSKDLELKEGIVYFLLGSSHDLKQNLMQGKTNYLVFSQTKEKHEKIEGTAFGLLYGVYLINDESEYITLKSYFQK